MDKREADFIARALDEFFDIEATSFRLPRRRVPEGEEAPPAKYAVITPDEVVITSVASARAYVLTLDAEEEV